MQEIRAALQRWFEEHTTAGRPALRVTALELHKRAGGYPARDGNHRMPACCRVMEEVKAPNDSEIYRPPSGQGSRFEIEYVLPRPTIRIEPGGQGRSLTDLKLSTAACAESLPYHLPWLATRRQVPPRITPAQAAAECHLLPSGAR